MISVVRLVFSMVGEFCRIMEKDKEREERLCCGLQFIVDEMEIVNAWIKDKEPRGAVQETMIRQLQELAYDIEDFMENLRWEPEATGKVHVAIGTDPRAQQLIQIEQFEKRIALFTKEWDKKAESTSSQGEDTDDLSDGDEDLQEEDLEGMDGPKRTILELLSPSPGEGEQLRVVSIVGCRGVGKTALARATYKDSSTSDAFDCVAWVEASGCNNKKGLLHKIQESVQAALLARRAAENVPIKDEGASARTLRDILSKKRCLVFIDDVQQAQMWKETVRACPIYGSKSRIIVTTSVRSVAKTCSSGSYVYSMPCLSNDHSKSLFWRKVYGKQREPSQCMVTSSESIFRKCGGLPLALIGVAKHLNLKGNDLYSGHCEEVGQNLGKDYLSGNNNAVTAFKEMRRALMQCYDNLPDNYQRFLLLYLSIFPRGHQIEGGRLVRRLVAERLVVNDGWKCFDKLIDQSIIEPVHIFSNSLVVKSCKVHDVVLEYIINKSVDKNVVTLIREREPLLIGTTGAYVRRISVQSSTKERFDELEDKSAALRSLTMFKSKAFDLKKYKMLRLLDLEGCTGLDKRFLEGLCTLLLLRYLNLRKTDIKKLPTNIEKLQCLETLDIRDTNVDKLPMEVILLPKLANLFGKFQLANDDKGKVTMKTLSEFLKNKSLLQTLSGLYVANKKEEHVILRFARNLKKVKVWDNTSSSSQRKRKLLYMASSSGGRMEQNTPCGTDQECSRSDNLNSVRLLMMPFNSLESVSIVTSGLCKDFLDSLEGPCTIRSIKLKGNLDSLPDSNKLSWLGSIRKLQLFSTGLTFKDLSALQYLCGLEYLKLVEHRTISCEDIFMVEKRGFESLKSLCIEAPNVPKMRFKEGAMESLTTLYLLCPFSLMQQTSEIIEGISFLANLSELILHRSMKQEWETVTNEHPNRPCVKRQP